MSERLFSEAMGELSDKYISEAINYKGKKKEQNIILWVKRSVVAAAIILAVGFGVLMVGDTEVRATVWRWVKEVYSGEWHKFSMETDVKEAANLKYELGWIPEGMEFVTKFGIMGGESFIYTDEKELVIVFSYSTDPEYVFYMDSVDNIKEEVVENYTIIKVEKGNGSEIVSRRLYEAGLVESAVEYNQFLVKNGYDRRLSVGNHEIPSGATHEEMARILCGMK